jgi:hypothetical protein
MAVSPAALIGFRVAIIGSAFFAVRDLASGTPSERSVAAFIASTAAAVAVAAVSLIGVWRAQRATRPVEIA